MMHTTRCVRALGASSRVKQVRLTLKYRFRFIDSHLYCYFAIVRLIMLCRLLTFLFETSNSGIDPLFDPIFIRIQIVTAPPRRYPY